MTAAKSLRNPTAITATKLVTPSAHKHISVCWSWWRGGEDKWSNFQQTMICILSWCEILARCTDVAANFIQCDIRRDSTALYTDSHTQDCQFRKYKETCLVSRNLVMALLLISKKGQRKAWNLQHTRYLKTFKHIICNWSHPLYYSL